MKSNWRPKEGWNNPYSEEHQTHLGFQLLEGGAPAIIPFIREATLKEVREWLKNQSHTISFHYCQIFLHDSELDALLQGKMPEEVKDDNKG